LLQYGRRVHPEVDRRDVHGSLVDRDDLPGDAPLPGPGDDTGADRGDGAAGGAVPVRPVLGGRLAVRAVAVARPVDGAGRLGGEGGDDLLRRGHDGKALAVVGLGFRTPWTGRGLLETPPRAAGHLVFGPGTRRVTPQNDRSRAKRLSDNFLA